MEVTIDQALQKGIEAHKAGQVQEAEKYYTAILKSQSKHPDANHNMGVLAISVGKVQEALKFFKTALGVNPNIAQYWLSYIDTLIKMNRLADAKAVFDQAKENGAGGEGFDQLQKRLEILSPTASMTSNSEDPPQVQLQPLINLYSQGQLQQALDETSQLLQQFSNSAILYDIQGTINLGLSFLDAALKSYKKALSIKPDYTQTYCNMSVALQKQGKLDESIKACNTALSLKPDFAEAYYNKGNALKDQNKLDESIEAYKNALIIKPNFSEAYHNLGYAINLKRVGFGTPDPDLQKIITSLLDRKTYIRPKGISKALISLLKFEPAMKKVFQDYSESNLKQSFHENVLALSEVPLLLKLMSLCPLADLEIEAILADIRSSLLSAISTLAGSAEALRFQSALALQCFTNEYVYNQSGDETKAVQSLEALIAKALYNGEQPTPQSILCLASYKALHKYQWCDLLIVTPNFEEVFIRQVVEPKQESKLKSNIPILEEITNKVSSKVREQYEVNPYPRWVNLRLRLEPVTISTVVKEVGLKLFNQAINEVGAPDILIAGCGTGQHSIGTAARFKNSKVLAIDLSLSSLAYAKRKADELGFQNIKYMQADILTFGKVDRQFDIIESSGVLHHLDDPMAGWRALTDCLKPGGLMRIGLYSELARQHIVKIREEIKQSEVRSNELEMRSFRFKLINSDKEHHKAILSSSDFYSLSTLRDLLFHVQEHRFTIAQIQDCLNGLGLKFCGFEAETAFQNFNRTNMGKDDLWDLDKWSIYEKVYPQTFGGMYQFWCQKVA